MAAEESRRRSYSEAEKDGILLAVAANAGAVEPTAARLGVPRMTVQDQWNRHLARATDLTVRHKEGQGLADRFLAISIAAQDRVLELIGSETSAYRAALVEGINLDKYLLLTGRPTSRTEVLRARYVEPAALRSLSAGVIDVQAQRVRGVASGASSSHLPAPQKSPKRRAKKATPPAVGADESAQGLRGDPDASLGPQLPTGK